MKKMASIEIVISVIIIFIGIFCKNPYKSWIIGTGISCLLFAITLYLYADMNETKINILERLSKDIINLEKEVNEIKANTKANTTTSFNTQRDIADIKNELLSNLGEDYIIPNNEDE